MGPRRSALLCSVLLCALALCFAAPALALEPAGDGWYWQLPQPKGCWLNGVAMPDAQHVWAVGSGGTILASSDGGAGWHGQPAPTGDPLNAVAFTDASHGCAVGGWLTNVFTQTGVRSSVILRTADGGTTWTTAVQPAAWGLTDVTFIDSQTGVAVGQHGTILRTADGGETWRPCLSGTTQDFGAVAFTDAKHGYALALDRYVARTVDGGLSWRTGPASEYYWDFVDGLAADGAGALWTASGMMWDDPGTLLRSGDGGRTWKGVRTGGDFGFWDVAASGAHICAVGEVITDFNDPVESTTLAMSEDGGATWTTTTLGQGVAADAVAMTGIGGVVAAGSGLVTSHDQGASWTGAGFDPPGVGSLDFVSATEGWSAGGNAWQRIISLPGDNAPAGSILHTSDGATWQEQYSDPRAYLLDVDFADASNGWAVGTRGAVRHTSDGGATWTAEAVGMGSVFGLVEAPTPSDAWVLGRDRRDRSAFLHTADAGATWSEVRTPAGLWPVTMRFPTGSEGWIAGWGRNDTRVAHTTDGGATWTTVRVPSAAALLPIALDFVDSSRGWMVGQKISDSTMRVLRTEDGGTTWSAAGAPFEDAVSSVDFVDDEHGWVAGAGVWSTDDGGDTWTQRTKATGYGSTVVAVDAGHVWAASYGHGIVSTVDASGDTAPPTTTSTGDRGWLRGATRITLTANDAGGSGVAGAGTDWTAARGSSTSRRSTSRRPPTTPATGATSSSTGRRTRRA